MAGNRSTAWDTVGYRKDTLLISSPRHNPEPVQLSSDLYTVTPVLLDTRRGPTVPLYDATQGLIILVVWGRFGSAPPRASAHGLQKYGLRTEFTANRPVLLQRRQRRRQIPIRHKPFGWILLQAAVDNGPHAPGNWEAGGEFRDRSG
jgi:hypothetical protein